MSESKSDEIHMQLAKELFNKTWDYLDMKERIPEDEVNMIHSAHASRYHWGVVGTSLQFERGEWQISRVYSVLGRPEPALYHAKQCLDICKKNEIGDFDIAFAYEAMARAYHLAGEEVSYKKYYEKAENAGKQIEDSGNKEYFMGELKTA
jgi:hypothetical protein